MSGLWCVQSILYSFNVNVFIKIICFCKQNRIPEKFRLLIPPAIASLTDVLLGKIRYIMCLVISMNIRLPDVSCAAIVFAAFTIFSQIAMCNDSKEVDLPCSGGPLTSFIGSQSDQNLTVSWYTILEHGVE